MMNEKELMKIIKGFGEKLPKFPDGRIDYHGSKEAPVITVFVKMGDNILLLKRSDKVFTYKGKWNSVAGYLDEIVPIKNKILEELCEEIGVTEDDIISIGIGDIYNFTDDGHKWMVTPVLVEIKKGTGIKLDWEHVEYKWINPEEITDFDIVPNLDKGLKIVMEDTSSV